MAPRSRRVPGVRRSLRRHRPRHSEHSQRIGDRRSNGRAGHRGRNARCRFTAFRSQPISSSRCQAAVQELYHRMRGHLRSGSSHL